MAPVNRPQSPISTANANPVSVLTPRKHPSRCTIGVHSTQRPWPSIAASRRSRRALTTQHRLVVGIEGDLEGQWTPKDCRRNQASCRRSTPSRRSRRCPGAARAWRAGGVPASGHCGRPHGPAPDRGRPPAPPLGTATAVTSPRRNNRARSIASRVIGLHPITRRALQLRRCRDHAPDPGRVQRPRQPEPGRPGLIGHRHRSRSLRDPGPDVLM